MVTGDDSRDLPTRARLRFDFAFIPAAIAM